MSDRNPILPTVTPLFPNEMKYPPIAFFEHYERLGKQSAEAEEKTFEKEV